MKINQLVREEHEATQPLCRPLSTQLRMLTGCPKAVSQALTDGTVIFQSILLLLSGQFNHFYELAFVLVSRKERPEEPAVPSELGLDLLREGTLRG